MGMAVLLSGTGRYGKIEVEDVRRWFEGKPTETLHGNPHSNSLCGFHEILLGGVCPKALGFPEEVAKRRVASSEESPSPILLARLQLGKTFERCSLLKIDESSWCAIIKQA